MDHQCDRQRQTESPLAIARSNIVRRALKGAKVSVLNAVMLFLWTVLVLEGSSRVKFVGDMTLNLAGTQWLDCKVGLVKK